MANSSARQALPFNGYRTASRFRRLLSLLLAIAGFGAHCTVRADVYLGRDGGLEGAATVDDSTTYSSAQSAKWTKENATLTIAGETTLVRSGANALRMRNASTTGRRVRSPLTSFSSKTAAVTIQYYRMITNVAHAASNQVGVVRAAESLQGTYDRPGAANTWEKRTYSPASATFTSLAGVLMPRGPADGTGDNIFIDDLCVYDGAADTTAPSSAGTVVVDNPTSSSLAVRWGAASGGVDGGGYLVVRYTSNPGATDDPNSNGIYATNNTITVGLTGTVCFQGTDTNFTDSGLAGSQTYYYKVYAYDKAYNYAAETTASGTTSGGAGLATVATVAGTATGTTTTTVGGEVTSDGGGTVTNRGVCYKTSAGVTIADNKTASGSGTGSFTADLSALAVDTRYYFKAYADNEAGSALGSELDIWTWANTPSAPTVAAPAASTLQVTVNENGNPAHTIFSIQTTNNSLYVQTNGTLGAVEHWQNDAAWGTTTITGLSPGSNYGFRVRAQNGAGTLTAYSAVGNGTTLTTAPTVTTTVADPTNATTATAGGNVTADGGATVTNRGVVWGTSAGPTVPGSQTTNSTGLGSFVSTLTNLTTGATFFYRAFAQNADGTAYGAEYALTTPCFGGSVTGVYASATNSTTFTAAWSNFSGASGYQLDVSTNADFGGGAGVSATIVQYDFPATASLIANTVDAGVTVSVVSLSSGTIETNITTGTYFPNEPYVEETTGWGASSQAAAKYFLFTIYPLAGQAITITGISYRAYATGAGPSAYSHDIDGGSATYTVNAPDSALVAISQPVTNVSNRSAPVQVRLQGWDNGSRSTAGSGVFRLDDVIITGTVGAPPELVPGYSNRAVAGTTASVTGLTEAVTYYFRVRATSDYCTTVSSATASVTTVVGPAPEIAVLGTNDALILSGDTEPDAADGTDFQAVLADGPVAVTNTFAITNSGTMALTISGVSTASTMGAGADFVVASWPAAVEPGTRSNLVLVFSPAAAGVRTALVTVANSDADEASYVLAVKGTGVAPEVAVSGNGVDIADGDLTPSFPDATDYGSILLGIAVTNSYTITNSGSATLTISGVTTAGAQAAEFMVVTDPAGTLAAGAATAFLVRFAPTGAGARSATLSIGTDDASEADFDFAVQGEGLATAPEVAILGTNGVEIADGTVTPTATEGTDFGPAMVAGSPVDRTLYITNSGTGDLAISGVATSGSAAADFIVLDFPSEVSPGTVSNLVLRFAPASSGTRGATLTVNNSDGNEATYDFAVQGAGQATATVATAILGAIGDTAAQAGGDVIADGGLTVTNRGVVYNTTGNPTLADSVVSSNAPGLGAYSSTLPNLTPGQGYYVRAFAQNGAGTSYGGVSNFTASCFTSGVVNLHADPTNLTEFTAVWSARAGATGYRIDVGTNATFTGDASVQTLAFQGFESTDTWNYVQTTATVSTVTTTSRTGTTSLRLEASGVATFSNLVLDAGAAATVSVAYAASGPDSGEDLFLELSYDAGTTWTQSVKLVDGFGNAALAFNQTNALDPTTVANPFAMAVGPATQVQVRVRTAALDASEYYFVDDISVRAASAVPGYVAGYSNRAVAGTSIAVTGLTSSTVYYYRVAPTNSACGASPAATALVTTASAPAPEIALLGTNGVVVPDGDTTPATADGTDFGSADLSTGVVDRVFVITNAGTAALSITGVRTSGAHAADFVVISPPAGTLAPGTATSFTVRFDPSAFGGRTATVAVASDDADEASYDFVVRGDGAISLGDAVDAPALTWVTDGTNAISWYGQTNTTHDGVDAAQSGRIGHNGATWFYADVTGPGTVTFWWKVSSETNFDTLDLFVGTNYVDSISGESGWLQYTASVPAGVHDLYWQYSKDGSTTGGQDAAWVDEVTFTPGSSSAWSDFSINGVGLTNLTDAQFGSAITIRVTYADSDGVNWNGTSLTPPDHSPFLSVTNPAGVELVAPVAFASAGHLDGEYTSVMTGVVTVGSVSTGAGFRVHLTGTDQVGQPTTTSFVFAVTDDDPAPPQDLEFTIDGVGGTGDTNLLAGAVAVVAVNGNPSNGLERFSFVVLSPYPAGTVIDFTDCGWNPAATNWHRPNEFHTNRYVSSGDADVGQVFTLTITNINNSGDQIAAYQYRGTNSAATDATNTFFISAINLDAEANGWDVPVIPDDNEHSGLYYGLTNGWSAVSIPNAGSNVRYTGTVVGTASALLQSIMNASNWVVEGSPRDIAISNYTFNVTGSGIFNWDVVEMTDAQLRSGGYVVTNVVQDLGSGLATNPLPYFVMINSNAGVIVSNTFAVSYTNGSVAQATLQLSATAGAYNEIVLGEVTGMVVVTDADQDRNGDGAQTGMDVSVLVTDDDAVGPVFSNASFSASGISGLGQSGTLLYYEFGPSAPATLQPDSQAGALAVADLTANGAAPDSATGYTAGSGGQSVSANGWNGSTNFWQVAITIQPGLTLQITGVYFATRSSATGPTNWSLAYSADGYGSSLAGGGLRTNATFEAATATVSAVAATNTLAVRLYGSGAASAAGTWRLDDLTLQGVIAVDPAANLVSDADLLTNGWSFSASVQDSVSGVRSNEDAQGPRYTLLGPGGAVALAATNFAGGPASNGAALASAVVCTARPAVAFADIQLGVHTARLTAVDFDDDRINDGATNTGTLVFTVLDDDTAAPQISVARGTYLFFEGKSGSTGSELTDGELADGISISDRVYDVRSGVLSTSLTFNLTDPAGWSSGRQLFPTRPADGQAQTNSYLGGGLVAVTNYNVDITNRTLGVWTARLFAADFDVDRPGDYAGVTQAFAVTVMDDDRVGPRMTNLQLAGQSAVLFATGFEDLDGWAAQSAATWTNLAAEGAWVSTGAYALAFNPRGDVGRHLGFNDAGDAVELPLFTNAGWIVAWARLSGNGTNTFALERFDGLAWTNAGTRSLTNVAYDVISWNLDRPETNASYRLRLLAQVTGGRSVYLDDLAVLPWREWTNQAAQAVSWSAANDTATGGSGIYDYRWVGFGGAAPVATNEGSTVAGLTTVAVAAVEGWVTGHVVAVDNDLDRGPLDRTIGPSLPVGARFDFTPPPLVTGCAVNTNVTDTETELGLAWTGFCANAGDRSDGTLLSPWASYVIFYTGDGSQPDTNSSQLSIFNGGPANLATNTTTSLTVSNLGFDTEYHFRVAGLDRAGNIGPLSATVTGATELFVVTQGVVRASNQVELAWTRSATQAVYDIIWQDAVSWIDGLTNQWAWMSTVTNSWGVDAGATNRVSPYSLNSTLRFYRVAREGHWQVSNGVRRASVQIHVANTWRLREGENWLTLVSVPETNTLAGVFGTNLLPAGSSPATASRISWFSGGTSNGSADVTVYLSSTGRWVYSAGGVGVADDRTVPLGEGFLLELPAGAAPRNLLAMGEVLTNVVSATAYGNGRFSVLSLPIPQRVRVRDIGLAAMGFRGAAAYNNFTKPDELRVLVNTNGNGSATSPRLRIWYNTSNSNYYDVTTGANVNNRLIEPDESLIWWNRGTSNTTWTVNPLNFYQSPGRQMNP